QTQRDGAARARDAQRQRHAERHATVVVPGDGARAGPARDDVEGGEHAAAVRGVGETGEGGHEREDPFVAAAFDGAAKDSVRGDHAIIVEVSPSILAHNAFVRATVTNFFFSLGLNGFVLLPLYIHALGGT